MSKPRFAPRYVCERCGLAVPGADGRSQACNLIGNLCRHSPFFYRHLRDNNVLSALMDRCRDRDAHVGLEGGDRRRRRRSPAC